MAKPTGETSMPLLISTIVFVLATLVLGYLSYTFNENVSIARAAQVKAEQDKKSSDELLEKEKEKSMLYRFAVGINTPEDNDRLASGIRFPADLATNQAAIADTITKRANTALSAEVTNAQIGALNALRVVDFFNWAPATAGGTVQRPETNILDAAVKKASQKELAERRVKIEQEGLVQAKNSLQKSSAALDTAVAKFTQLSDKFPNEVKAEVKKATDQFEAFKNDFIAKSGEYRNEKNALSEAKADLTAEIARANSRIATQRNTIDTALALEDDRIDPFQYDKPQFKVIRRTEKLIDIDIGTASNLRVGQTFSIFPSDTPTRGFQPRMRKVRDFGGKEVFKAVPKGKVEVIEILGATLSQCRITEEDSEVRDRILAGDLGYNSIWRNGVSEHIVLFGIFDLDGDGKDDIQTLVSDLRRAGVTVDGYYDLGKMAWVGDVKSQTAFAVEGYYPTVSVADGNKDGKLKIINAIGAAKTKAKNEGVRIIRPRDFFPRIGYNAKLDVTEDSINQAATGYIRSVSATEGTDPAPAAPAPEPKKN